MLRDSTASMSGALVQSRGQNPLHMQISSGNKIERPLGLHLELSKAVEVSKRDRPGFAGELLYRLVIIEWRHHRPGIVT